MSSSSHPNSHFKPPTAFVLFDRVPPWTNGELRARHARLFRDDAASWQFPRDEDHKAVALVHFDDAMVACIGLDLPVPGHDFAAEIRRSPWWPEAAEAVAEHRANVMLSLMAGSGWPDCSADTRLAGVRRMGQLLAAFADLPGAVAVNLVESGSLYSAATAVQMLQEGPPPHFWVRTWRFEERLADGRPGVGALTMGLRTFAGRELHFHPVAAEDANRIASYCERLGWYLLANGPVLGDGDTLEFEPGQAIRVTYGVEPGSDVPLYEVRLDRPEPAPPVHPAGGDGQSGS
jgi:hypothetical protein